MPSERPEHHDAGKTWKVSCPRCRYDTRGLASERCPECGITRDEAAALVLAKERAERAVPLAALGTVAALPAAFIACICLSSAHDVGFYNDTERVRMAIGLAACGGIVAIAVINWMRIARRRKLLRLWWMALLGVLLLSQLPP